LGGTNTSFKRRLESKRTECFRKTYYPFAPQKERVKPSPVKRISDKKYQTRGCRKSPWTATKKKGNIPLFREKSKVSELRKSKKCPPDATLHKVKNSFKCAEKKKEGGTVKTIQGQPRNKKKKQKTVLTSKMTFI